MAAPSSVPTLQPSSSPSRQPSSRPSSVPSNQPSSSPSSQPSVQPSTLPTGQPTTSPSLPRQEVACVVTTISIPGIDASSDNGQANMHELLTKSLSASVGTSEGNIEVASSDSESLCGVQLHSQLKRYQKKLMDLKKQRTQKHHTHLRVGSVTDSSNTTSSPTPIPTILPTASSQSPTPSPSSAVSITTPSPTSSAPATTISFAFTSNVEDGNTADGLAEQLSSSVNNAVTSGTFSETLISIAVANNVTSLTSESAVAAIRAVDEPMIEVGETILVDAPTSTPTATPTSFPSIDTIAPTMSPSMDGTNVADLNINVNVRGTNDNNDTVIAFSFVGFIIAAFFAYRYFDLKKKNRINAGIIKTGGLLNRKKLKSIDDGDFDEDLDAMMAGAVKTKPTDENFKTVKIKPTGNGIENHDQIAQALKALLDSNQLAQVLGEIQGTNFIGNLTDEEEKSADIPSSPPKKPFNAVLAEMRSPSVKAAVKQKPAKASRRMHKYAVHAKDIKRDDGGSGNLYSGMRRPRRMQLSE